MKNRHSKKSRPKADQPLAEKSLHKKKKFFKKAPPKVTKKPIFPSISRIIPELNRGTTRSKNDPSGRRYAELGGNVLKRVVWNKYFLVSFISVFISVGIALQGVELTRHLAELQKIRNEREQVRGEIAYWEDVIKKREDYRDGYFKLALLEYRLGDREKAKEYIDKTLFIDPNYKAALDFQREIEGKK